jgi:hydrogenase maturation protein HypF
MKLRRPRSAFRGTARVTELDGTIWGGEFFLVTDESVERIAHLRPFRLPGGDKAVKEPRRTALGLLHEMSGDAIFSEPKVRREGAPNSTRGACAPLAAFSSAELATLKTMLAKNLNSPVTTSMGRLFDAVASLINLRQQIRFEGQAAMELEFAIDGVETAKPINCRLKNRPGPQTNRK